MRAAERHLDALIEDAPEYWPAYTALGFVDLKRNRVDRAQENLRTALDHNSSDTAARLLLAEIYVRQGDVAAGSAKFDDAAAAFSQAFALRPSAELALRTYTTAQRAGRAKPERELAAWDAHHPNDPRIDFALGSAALQRSDWDAAIGRFESVLDAEPKNAAALNDLAWLYSERNDPRAVELATRAHRVEPKDPHITDTLGSIQVRRGNAAAGLPLLAEAAAAAPDQAEIRYHWAVALSATGRATKAREVLRALLDTDAAFPSRSDAERLVAQD